MLARASPSLILAQWSREMLVNQKPVRTTLLPYAGIAHVGVRRLAIFCFFRKMHGNGRPGYRAVPRDPQVFARREGSAGHVREEFLLDAVVVFLPAMVREGRKIVEYQAVLLGV